MPPPLVDSGSGAVLPPVYTLLDELLADIFIRATVSDFRHDLSSLKNVFFLASVSRIFRKVCLETAGLWTVVTMQQKREARALCLARSKGATLRVYLPFDDGFEGYGSFLADVIPHAHRWEELYFRIHDTTSKRVYILTSLSIICHNLFLPCLTKLHLVMPVSDPWNLLTHAMNDNPSSDILHFYRTWRTPRLKTLTTENLMPLSTGSDMLERCKIIVREKNAQGSLRVPAMLDFASSWHSLRKLVIYFGEEPIITSLPPILLPQAEFVKIGLTLGGTVDSPAPNYLMDALHMPRVKHLAIAFAEGACLDLNKCVPSLFPAHEAYAALESLRLANETCVSGLALSDAELDTFNFVISRLPRLQYLTLDLPTFVPPKTLRRRMPPLRSLRLYDSPWIDTAFLKMVVASLQAGSDADWQTFKTLEVGLETQLDLEELRDVFPGASIRRVRYVEVENGYYVGRLENRWSWDEDETNF